MRRATTPLPHGAALVRAAGVLVCAAAALLLLTARPAAAHAVLEGGSVRDGQVLDVPPAELLLEFNEPVSAPRGGLRVFDSSGERVDVGGTRVPADAPRTVRTDLEPDLPQGTYVLTYRVTSADGHPVAGALVFSVGAETGSADALVASLFSADADRPFAVAAAVARWAAYAAALLLGGALAVLWWLRTEVGDDRKRLTRTLRVAAWAVIATSVLTVLLQNALVTGAGVGALVDGPGLVAVLASFTGLSATVRALGAGVALFALRHSRAGLGLAGGAAAVGSFLLQGHTLTTQPAWLMWLADGAHLATAATWFGGLVVIAVLLRARQRADDPVGAARLVGRFSALATASVLTVVAAGLVLAWLEVRALRALTSSPYGWTLVVKSALVVPVLALGLYNNRRLVPAIARRRRRAGTVAGQPVPAGGAEGVERADAAWRRLAAIVRVEAALLVAVLGVTGVLVSLQPAAEAAGITGAYSTTVPFEEIGQMTVTVDPNRVGRNEVHLYLLTETGRPAEQVDDVTVSLSQPDLDIGPIRREPRLAGPGHFIYSGPDLSVPGTWEVTVEVATSRFDVATATVAVTVNP